MVKNMARHVSLLNDKAFDIRWIVYLHRSWWLSVIYRLKRNALFFNEKPVKVHVMSHHLTLIFKVQIKINQTSAANSKQRWAHFSDPGISLLFAKSLKKSPVAL